MLLSLPLEIWEIIFDLLPGQDLYLLSKIPRLRDTLARARRSAHRLEGYRTGLVDVSPPGSRSLPERVDLLRTFRTRWESLCWTDVTRLSPRTLWMYHFAGDVLVYIQEPRPSVLQFLRLPFGGTSANSWENDRLGLEHWVKTFLANPENNLLAVLEEWFDNGIPRVKLHVRRLDLARDILVFHGGKLTACHPFTTDIDIDVPIPFDELSCEIEQIGPHISILFSCYASHGSSRCAKFFMWDVSSQEQVANVTSSDYRSFAFLDRRWVLFGAIPSNIGNHADHSSHPYLEIIDPITPTHAIRLELDKSPAKHTSTYSTVDISIRNGASHEESSSAGNGGMPFALDPSRGVISAYTYCYNCNGEDTNLPWYESHVFVMDIGDIVSKILPLSNPEQRCIEWKNLAPYAAVFSDASVGNDRHRIFSRHAYMAGFRYVSPIQPLDPKDLTGPRCFFIYDFNPYREALDCHPGLGDLDPETGYPKGASEIVREVVGGLGCWKMRFDLPAAGEDVEKCYVALTAGGVVLFESNALDEETITVFSMW